MVDTSKIPETVINAAPASQNRFLRPMSEGGGAKDAEFVKAFDTILNGSARTTVLKRYGLSESDFDALTEGQKNTLKLEMQKEVNTVSDNSLYGKDGIAFVDGKWVRRD